jgi:RNA polymerase sigma-70 factor (ECF subfamily)
MRAVTEPSVPREDDIDDLRLVEAARRGDRDAFGVLYRRHVRLVRAVLLARLDYQDVPDEIQEVFLSAWSQLRALRDGRVFGAWVATIARNRARAHVRQRVALAELRDVVDSGGPSAEALEAIRAISTLPDAYRETLLLRYVEGMTGPEIALRTGLTEGSVRVNLHRGMRLLRERLRVPAAGRASS